MIESIPATISTPAALRVLPMIRVARKGALVLGIRLAGAGLALVLQISLARALGHAGYGEFAYVFAWLQLAAVLAHGGFATAALRYVAEYTARSQPGLVRGFLTRSSQIALLEAIALALLMAGCAAVVQHANSASNVRNFLVAGAALPVLSQFALGNAVIRGLGHVIPSMLVVLVHPVLLLGALTALVYLLGIPVSSTGALLLNLGAAIGAFGAVFLLRRHFERGLDRERQCSFLTGEWIGTATQMMLASFLIYLQGRTGVIATGLLLDAQAAGMYAAMERLADVALLGLVSVNMLVAPRFAAVHAQRRRDELERYARLAALGSSGFMLATVAPLVLVGEPILRLFGDAFVSGYPLLLVLLGGVAVNAICGSVGYLLSMTGHQRDNLIVASLSLCLNLALCLLLIPRYGAIGAAAANALAIATWNITMLLIVRRRLGIWACIGPIR